MKLKVEIPDCSPAALSERIKKGLEVCNGIQAKIRECRDEDYQKLSDSLDLSVRRLNLIVYVGSLYGVNECVFGECRFSDQFICFSCSRKQEAPDAQ